ncbi:hypothetical protein [Curtobacterium ammoniigenes]|uniref:hypothetical protein n=1 Tax=Curtobacterium ammoniigenes TaxID=395387 RepID=UPI00082D6BD4|nr:hypothetical protein [Curtobacterium ammoniigenes]
MAGREPINPDEETWAEALSARAEAMSDLPPGVRVERSASDRAGAALLAAAVGPEEVERIGRGRPSLAGASGGPSPSRTVRLPRDLDAALVARANEEHRRPSELVRDAVIAYLIAQHAL